MWIRFNPNWFAFAVYSVNRLLWIPYETVPSTWKSQVLEINPETKMAGIIGVSRNSVGGGNKQQYYIIYWQFSSLKLCIIFILLFRWTVRNCFKLSTRRFWTKQEIFDVVTNTVWNSLSRPTEEEWRTRTFNTRFLRQA